MNEPKIIMTKLDVMRIRKLLAAGFEWPASVDYNRLKKELDRAEIVDSRDIPPHVVTMNSRVIYTDTDTGTQHEVTLVYPHTADVSKGRISILSPLGSALILKGMAIGLLSAASQSVFIVASAVCDGTIRRS